MKLCVIITVSQNLYSLYRKQFSYLMSQGYDITAIAAPGPEHELLRRQGIKTVEINMVKRPSPFQDLCSLLKIWKHLLLNRYDIVSVSTPKASLLGSLAAFFSFHKNIIFTLRGRAYENEVGLKRKFYTFIDKVICFISTKVFCISKEIMDSCIENKIVSKDKIFVLGQGSSNGVDLGIFTKNDNLIEKSIEIRSRLGIGSDELVLLYSGRIRNDKGIRELVDAFGKVSLKHSCHLIIQGEFDNTDPIDDDYIKKLNNNPRIYLEPWSFEVEKYFATADIFVFPSYREGFGNVAIEASSMELPVIAFDVIGCRESILDHQTGLLVEPYSVHSLSEAISQLIDNPELRKKYGKLGRERVEKHFDSKIIWDNLSSVYRALVKP
ncbi:glycosyltransferase family 4 protein [Vibrio antiquarius]|uniref:glycosyltransferase family 4 protein n=1 Tax=Vibrio antiquarius (strain Ex25) TaxID=150340 RepID=UPI00265AE7D9|nr:glycosyltransferase family 4 protein [Vibrio antiquarius]MCR9628123.1 glycosyltransferase family 4 protein [Vibrio antiquarius]MCR9634358.1 glycosyltransferase family 4 protein [Vibrio antiquarius]